MNDQVTLLRSEFLLTSHDARPETGMAVAVVDDRIVEVGDSERLLALYPCATKIELVDCILMPGLVNAHQHGRGVSQIQLGYPDQRLELWMAERRSRGVPDIRAIGLLACVEMLRNGVTCAVHADLAYGSGDYEAELRAAASAYDQAGMRANIAIGVCDQGAIVFPQSMESSFLDGLPRDLKNWLIKPRAPSYAKDWPATSRLMDRLQADYSGNERIRFCYGPSGPHWVSEDLFKKVSRDAERRGVELHIHAAETIAQFEACNRIFAKGTMRELRDLGAIGERTVIAHGVFLTDDDLDVLAAAGAMTVTNPGSNLRLCDSTARLPDMASRGIRIGVGSDNSTVMDDEDLLSEARVAKLLRGRSNWGSPARLDAPRILRMLTEDGAYATGFGGKAGRIERGWLADLTAISLEKIRGVYLDEDMSLVEALVARGKGSDVRMTMVGGRILYKDGRFTYLNCEDIAREAGLAARAARVPRDRSDTLRAAELKPFLSRFYAELSADARVPDILSP